MPHIFDLTNPTNPPTSNITLDSGLVCDLQNGSTGKAKTVSLKGHNDGTIFVFDKQSRELIKMLTSGQKVGLGENLLDMLSGVKYVAYSVSSGIKRVRFTADIQCATVTLNKVAITLDIAASDARQLAVEVFQGADPVLHLCESLKSKLSRSFNSVQLRNMEEWPSFRQRLYDIFDGLQVNSNLLQLSAHEIVIESPKAVQEWQNEALSQHGKVQKVQGRLALQELELQWAGVRDPHMKLMLSDVATRTIALQKTLDHRIESANRQSRQADQIVQKKLDMLGNFLRHRITDQTSVDEIQQLVRLLGEAESQTSIDPRFKILDDTASQPRSLGTGQSSSPGAGRVKAFNILNALPAQSSEDSKAQTTLSGATGKASGATSDPPTPVSRPPRFQPPPPEIADEDAL